MIALVDYGAGNLTSVRKALAALTVDVFTPERPEDLRRARQIIVPGVGHFDATRSLQDGWREEISARIAAGIPFLGICLGLQWLFEGSAEAADVKGLGLFAGECCRLPADLKVPHVGWNSLEITDDSKVLNGIPAGGQVYFTHSYAAPLTPHTTGVTEYGVRFSAVVERDNVAGVQFHPEKSGAVGLAILRNWIDRRT